MTAANPQLQAVVATIRGLLDAVSRLQDDAPTANWLAEIVGRGDFRPAEDEAIGYWYARFLTVRESLWDVIEEVLAVVERPAADGKPELRYFLIGYAAVCLLVRIDRILLFEVAGHSIIQRKLNEAFPEHRIARKQFTRIFSAFVDQKNALRLREAMSFARNNRQALLRLRVDPDVGFIVDQLPALEASLDPSKRNYLKGAWHYVSHKWRRRGVVSVSKVLAGVMEGVGRTASEFYEADNKKVSADIRDNIAEFLQPGDIVITRHALALTNLFMPGFWPHAALYIGTPQQRDAANIDPPADKKSLWIDDICVLEARKDGVRLRPLSDTLSVDLFVVLRPNLSARTIRLAIERAVPHEGKMYNFDFDFFNSDRLVCTEVVYRSYDGLDGLQFPLYERAGRKTLSAEDLLDFALDTRAFEPVAIFGVEGFGDDIVFGDRVREALIASYRNAG